jgi:tellurite resistance protein TerC
VTDKLHGAKFFMARQVTPLFLALIMIELCDVIFALDSVPAVFSVTLDPFIVLTSNVFAILGLRALYFLLAHAAARFAAIEYAVALILMLTGIKMLVAHWLVVPTWIMLLGVVGIFGAVIGWRVWLKPKIK